MAKIRYLVNGDPYFSMVHAIKSENITYARLYKNFKEYWGRLSTLYFEGEWDDEIAKRVVGGVEVFGANEIALFTDYAVDFKYTKKMVELIGGNYDELVAGLGDVERFVINLKGVTKILDFQTAGSVKNAMSRVKTELENVDSIEFSTTIEHIQNPYPFTPVVLEDFNLSQIRHNGSGVFKYLKYNGSYRLDLSTEELDKANENLFSNFKFMGLPSSKTRIEEVYETVEDENGEIQEVFVSASEYKDFVPPKQVVLEEDIKNIIANFLAHTDYFDDIFNSISVVANRLPDEIIPALTDYEDDVVIERCEYSIKFSFNSTVDTGLVKTTYADGTVEYPEEPASGLVVDQTDYAYLVSNAFATKYSDKYTATKAIYDAEQSDYESSPIVSYFESPEGREGLVLASISSMLSGYSSVSDVFHTRFYGGSFITSYYTWIRYDKLNPVRNAEFVDLIFTSLKLDYKEKKSGWFGGSWLGKILEGIFTVVVVIVGAALSITGNAWALVIAVGLLFGAAKYTGMSKGGTMAATMGMKALAIVGIATGIYNIYDMAYNTVADTAVNEAIAQSANQSVGLSYSELMAAEASVTFANVVSAMTPSSLAMLATSLYSAFNLIAPMFDKPSQADSVESEILEENEAIYNIDTAYSFYDEVYNIY